MNRWSIVLAGGEGQRLKPLTQRLYADGRPKQFCALGGSSRTMLEQTLDRVRLLSPTHRTLVSVCRHHRPWQTIYEGHAVQWSVQPGSNGTGTAVLLAGLEVEARDPGAVVGLFPSDHFVSDDFRFMAYVHQAAVWVEHRPADIVLLGVEPDRTESDYGWLVPRFRGPRWNTPEPARLVEKPAREVALRLAQTGALWNTAVTICRVETLMRLLEILATDQWRALSRAFANGPEALEQAFLTLRPLDLSRDVFGRATSHIRLLPVRGVAWSDWGTEDRIRESLPDLPAVPSPAPERSIALAD